MASRLPTTLGSRVLRRGPGVGFVDRNDERKSALVWLHLGLAGKVGYSSYAKLSALVRSRVKLGWNLALPESGRVAWTRFKAL